MAATETSCEACGSVFAPKRSTARFCSTTCRQRAARQRKAAVVNAVEAAKTGTDAEHGLVKAVRTELQGVGKDQTFNGQLALQLARRLANPEESGSTALSKELRAVMAEALKPTPQGGADADRDGTPDPVEEDDEVTRARRQREEARQAAGLG